MIIQGYIYLKKMNFYLKQFINNSQVERLKLKPRCCSCSLCNVEYPNNRYVYFKKYIVIRKSVFELSMHIIKDFKYI